MTSSLDGFLAGETGDITYPTPVYVIEHDNGLVLVDTGLHPDLATDTSRLGALDAMFDIHLPADGSGTVGPALQAAGFDAAQVSHLVMTHLHFDHSGGMVEVPNAQVVVHANEWAALGNDLLVELGIYNPADADLGHDRLEVDDDHDLFGDGTITCLQTPGHTPGHQSVRVQTEEGTFVLCGDCCYVRRSLDDEHLPNFSLDADQHLESIRRLKGEQSNGATLIFGHDPEQWAAIETDGVRPSV